MDKLKCVKCGHEWLPRQESKPKECPNCKSTNWDKIIIKEYKTKSINQLNYMKKRLLEKLKLIEEKIQKINPRENTPFKRYVDGEIGIKELYELEDKDDSKKL
jgi:DNA-directed RNA polymerase subunit RPC12/RpoP